MKNETGVRMLKNISRRLTFDRSCRVFAFVRAASFWPAFGFVPGSSFAIHQNAAL